MESIKQDILGCATIAVVKPSQGLLIDQAMAPPEERMLTHPSRVKPPRLWAGCCYHHIFVSRSEENALKRELSLVARPEVQRANGLGGQGMGKSS